MARLSDNLLKIARRCATRPVEDSRPPDDIIGYDEHGLPADSPALAEGAPDDAAAGSTTEFAPDWSDADTK